MMCLEKIGLLFLLGMNVATFVAYALDKWFAKKRKWRISEFTLLTMSFFGSLGALLAMKIFHHKTLHKKFTVLVPFFLLMWVAIFILYINWQNQKM